MFWPAVLGSLGCYADIRSGTGSVLVEKGGTVRIEFLFDLDKATASMAYLLERLGPVEKVKLMKLLYIADRNHFIQHGRPITGSEQVAMDHGPLPSACLEALDKNRIPQFVNVDQLTHVVSLKSKPDGDILEASERDILDKVISAFGAADKWALKKHTHKFQEFKRVYIYGTSKPISYELLLELYGGDKGNWRGQPVVSETSLKHMVCPFPVGSDTDL